MNPAYRHEIARLGFFLMFLPVLGFLLPCIYYHNEPSICIPVFSGNWEEELPCLTDLLLSRVR